VVRALRIGGELHGAGLSRTDEDDIQGGLHASRKTLHDEAPVRGILEPHAHEGAFANSKDWARHEGLSVSLGEGEHGRAGTIHAHWAPVCRLNTQRNGQHSGVEGACRVKVVVQNRDDRRSRLRRNQQQDERQHQRG
jgi:hypothetical protein